MYRPETPDRAGRGELCRQIDELSRELVNKHLHPASRDEYYEHDRIAKALDNARAKLHRLYGK